MCKLKAFTSWASFSTLKRWGNFLQVVQFADKKRQCDKKNGLLLQSVKVEILCDAVDSLRRNGIFVGGYSKATLWHTLNLRSAAVFPP